MKGFDLGLWIAAVAVGLSITASSCGTEPPAEPLPPPIQPTSCTVTQQTNGATISCPDGSSAFVSNGVSCKCKRHHND